MARVNGKPTTIQPGLPKLPCTPVGWNKSKLREHLLEIKRPIDLVPDATYKLVTVKRARGGVEERCVSLGSEIKTPTQFTIQSGDFLISKRQIVHGACGLVPSELDGSIVSNEYAVIRSHGGIDLLFLRYLSETVYFQQACFHSSIGIHIEKMIFNVDRWLDWQFNIPSLPEQLRIVDILRNWDESIAILENLVENSRMRKIAIMQNLLSTKNAFKSNWHNVKLGDLVTINPPRPPKPSDGRISFVPMDAVSESARLKYLVERDYGEVSTGFSSFRDNDILVAKITPCFENGKGAIVSNLTNGIGFGSTEFHVLRPRKGVSAKFLYQVTNSYEFRVRGEANMQGSAGQKRVPTDFLRSFKFCCPVAIKEQEKIATVLDNLDEQFENLKLQSKLLKDQRTSLIQQLFTGKRRVEIDNPLISKVKV